MAMQAEDVRYATLLSELVYRAAECHTEDSFSAHISALESELGASLPIISHHKSGGQRYLVGESDAAIYVAFQGTRTPTDWLANLAFFHGPLWHHKQQQKQQQQQSHQASNSSSSSRRARAHGGFIRRANHAALSIDALHAAAAAAGKRLVLTGHSLGGAVATLTTVRLLRALAIKQQALPDPRIRCISFATPAVANADLLQEVATAGWDQYITNIILPEDPVVPFVNLLLKAPTAPTSGSSNLTSSSLSKLNLHSSSSSNSNNSKASSRIMAGPHRSDSSDSTGSLPSRSSSWDSLADLTFSAQQQALAMQAAAAGWDFDMYAQPQQEQAAQQVYAHAAAGAGALALASSGDSTELTSWLAAARSAVQRQRQQRRPQLHRSLSDASVAHSASSGSLSSLSAASDSSSASSSSLAAFTSGLEATLIAASAAASQWLATSSEHSSKLAVQQQLHSGSNSSNVKASSLRSSNGNSSWPRLSLAKAGMTAFITGALAAGVRCSAALAAPQLLGPQLSLLNLLPAALTAPVALAAVHLVGKAALPVSHPLGQQFVMTGAGLEPVLRPLKSYPRNGEGLDLKQLGGLFPGHRMIAYRRRMVTLLQQGTWQQ